MSSRNTIPARRPGLTVVVGWDNPLGTFFAQVDRQQDDDDPRDPTLLWVGCIPGEILRTEDLVQPLAPYVELTEAHLATLRTDRAADADRAPSPLQRAMLGRFGRR